MWDDKVVELETIKAHKYKRKQEDADMRQRCRSTAAEMYHALYPRSNFFAKSSDMQRQWENLVRKGYETWHRGDLPEGGSRRIY